MDSNKGYWKRQLYMLSSLGLFYVILIALFAIPLVGTFVVILIKGALDLRYFIIAGALLGLAILGVIIIRALKRLRYHFIREGFKAGEMVRRHQAMGQPIEISLLGGLLKFTTGQLQAPEHLPLAHRPPSLLPYGKDRQEHSDIICQLQGLSELKRTGTIDADEFNLLKGVLIEASATSPGMDQKDSDLSKKTEEYR
jgi:hypothetical protein